MPAFRDGHSTVLHFGKGDLAILLGNDRVEPKATRHLMFLIGPKGEVGRPVTDEEFKFTDGNSIIPVVMTFDSTASLEVLIGQCQELKKAMEAEAVECSSEMKS